MKTRLYTRKRALISSVAMLLVAMIALGTATFAWFTSRPDANATGLKMKATAANGLVILTASHEKYITDKGASVASTDWTHDDFLNYYMEGTTAKTNPTPVQLSATSFDLSNLKLASSNANFKKGVFATDNAYTVDAADDTNYVAADDATVTNATAGYYQETIRCKVTGAMDTTAKDYRVRVTSLNVTKSDSIGTDDLGKALFKSARIALEYKDSSKSTPAFETIGVYSLNDAETETSENKYITTKDKTYSQALSSDTYEFIKLTDAPINNDKTNSNMLLRGALAGTVGNSGNDQFRITIYLDGEDANCKTSNYTVQELISEVELNLYLDAQDKSTP